MNINAAVIKMQGRSRMDAVPPERRAARAGGAAPRPRPGRGHLRPGPLRPRALGRAARQAAFPEPPSCAASDVRGSKLSASRPAASGPESSPPPGALARDVFVQNQAPLALPDVRARAARPHSWDDATRGA